MADRPSRGLADVVAASTAVSEANARKAVEHHADNRLIRPDSEYIGERGLTWVPVGQR